MKRNEGAFCHPYTESYNITGKVPLETFSSISNVIQQMERPGS